MRLIRGMTRQTKKYDNTGSKGVIMIGVLFVLLFLGILLTITYLRLDSEFAGTIAQSKSTRSLFIAEAGIERAVSILRTNPGWRAGFAGEPLIDAAGAAAGFYTVTFVSEVYNTPWRTLEITSIGRLAAGDPDCQRTIYAKINVANPAEFFAFTTDKTVVSNGATIQNGSLYAREIEFYACPAYLNNLVITQPTYYTTNYTQKDPNGAGNAPDIDIVTIPTRLDKPVGFPSLDADNYKRLAKDNGGRYYPNNKTFDNGIDLEDGENGVIFVEGDIYIKGEIADPVTVVATGNIYITGDITWTENGEGDPVGKLGLFSKKDIYIAESAPENLSVRGLLISEGIFEALGTKGSKGILDFDGSMVIKGDKGKPYGAVDLSVYGVRNYNYDSSLLQFPALPFVTYIANLDSWKEK